MDKPPLVTIDGPSGVGKGTLGRALADHYGWLYLDSGSLYRAVAVIAQQKNIIQQDVPALCQIASDLEVAYDQQGRLILHGQLSESLIRTEQCGNWASNIATHKLLRVALLQRQQQMWQLPGLVADGRDMGTVVFPNAPLKIFLTASPLIRAERRYKQLKQQGINVKLSCLMNEVEQRDARDMARQASPLIAANDAIVVDSSEFTIPEMFQQVLSCCQQKFNL